jgi:hypothetical protein
VPNEGSTFVEDEGSKYQLICPPSAILWLLAFLLAADTEAVVYTYKSPAMVRAIKGAATVRALIEIPPNKRVLNLISDKRLPLSG